MSQPLHPYQPKKTCTTSGRVKVAFISAIAFLLVAALISCGQVGNNPSPTPPPTPSPTPPPTPYTITSPKDGSSVPVHILVQGTAPQTPQNKELWLFVQSGGYFPQGDTQKPTPILVSGDGKWNVDAYAGRDTDSKGMPYVLYLVLVDKNSKGSAAIEQYFADARAGKGYNPISPLPDGIQPVTQVAVTHA